MKRLFAASTALLALGLAGCATDQKGMAVNRSLDSVHQPVVQRSDYTLDLASTGANLAPGEDSRLARWFDSLRIAYGDTIYVDDAYGAPGVRADVARVAGAYGLLLSDSAPATAGSVQPGSVRVIVSRTTASVPGCPDWHQSGTIGAPVSTAANFGCATNSNLAAMVANPNDLVLGQTGRPAGDAATASKAIKAYRDAKTTGSEGLSQVSTKDSK